MALPPYKMFQFQTGSIRRQGSENETDFVVLGFNSKLVRLEGVASPL